MISSVGTSAAYEAYMNHHRQSWWSKTWSQTKQTTNEWRDSATDWVTNWWNEEE